MKKYAMLVLASAFIFNVATIAQEQTPPQGKKGERKEFKQAERPQISAEKRAERMTSELGLTDAEKVKVQALFEKQDAKRSEHQATVKKVKVEQKTMIEADRKAQDAELEKIIGNEKFQKLETKRTEHQVQMKARREVNQGHRFGERKHNKRFNPAEQPQVSAQDRADRMAKKFGLTDLEKTKVQALFENQVAKRLQHQAEMKKMRDEQKAGFGKELKEIIGAEKFQKLETERTEKHAKLTEKHGGIQKHGQGKAWQTKGFRPVEGFQVSPVKRAERMAKELGLTDTEKAKVQAMFEKQEQSRVQHQAEINKIREEQKSKFEAERKAQDTELESIIGKDKFQQLQTLRTEHQKKNESKKRA